MDLVVDGCPSLRIGQVTHRAVVAGFVRSGLSPGQGSVEIHDASGLGRGDAIELRNEFRFGRGNYPKVHPASVVAIEGNRVEFHPPVSAPDFRGARGNLLLKRLPPEEPELSIEPAGSGVARGVAAGRAVEWAIEAQADRDPDRFTIRVRRRWLRDCLVEREHLQATLLGPLARVFRKNRRIDRAPFQSQYWLGDQGCAFPAGLGKELVVFGGRQVAALELHSRSSVQAQAITPFRRDPYGVASMLSADPFQYASSPGIGGTAAFKLVSGTAQRVAGVRLMWHHRDSRPRHVEIVARDAQGNALAHAEASPQEREVESFVFDEAVRATVVEVRCELRPGSGLMVRRGDLLWAGDRFALDMVLDDARMHRHYQVLGPASINTGTGGAIIDCRHWTRRSAGEEEVREIVLHVLPEQMAAARPRLHHVPDGYPAAFIWTEHADNTSIQTHRAVCFGSSRIADPSEATGGFVGSGVPVTKTVFHANPTNRPVAGSAGPQASILGDPDFAELCASLHRLGWDIGLHSPQPDNSTRAANERAIKSLAERYDARVWIDHSCSVIHNGVSALGMVPDQPHYIGDLLARYGLRYCWTFASEDASELYRCGLSIQQTRVGDWAVTPLMWQHPPETGTLWIWPSSAGSDFSVVNAAELDELIDDQGVAIMHAYPAYVTTSDSPPYFIERASEGHWRTTTRFEGSLREIAKRRDMGLLLPTTIRRWCTYVESIKDVDIYPSAAGTWIIRNTGNSPIEGLAVLVPRGHAVSGSGRVILRGDDTVCIRDIRPGEVMEAGAGSCIPSRMPA